MGNDATAELGGSKSPKNASVKVIAAGKRQGGGSLIRESSINSPKRRLHVDWETPLTVSYTHLTLPTKLEV